MTIQTLSRHEIAQNADSYGYIPGIGTVVGGARVVYAVSLVVSALFATVISLALDKAERLDMLGDASIAA